MNLSTLQLGFLLCCLVQQIGANLSGEICTDVSIYTPVQWHTGEVCCKSGVGVPDCRTNTIRVCVEHRERKCRIDIKDELEMKDCPINTTMIVHQPQQLQPWRTVRVPHEITHTKYNYTCENKTRQNCENIWVTDEQGIKTSTLGDCEDVVWLDCKKKPYDAFFTTFKTEKIPDTPIKYQTCTQMGMTNIQMCAHGKKVAVSICEIVKRKECRNVEEKICEPRTGPESCVSAGDVPWQEREHREKCLEHGTPPPQHTNTPTPPPTYTYTPTPTYRTVTYPTTTTTTTTLSNNDPFWQFMAADLLTRKRLLDAGAIPGASALL